MRDALRRVGVPAVLAGHRERLRTPAARRLAGAAARPGAAAAAPDPRAALTCFLGRTAAELCAAPTRDALLDELGATLRGWADVLHGTGVAALLEAVTTGTGCPRAARRRRTASGGSPTSATSARRCTRPPSTRTSARRRWSSGCATASTRPRPDVGRAQRRLESDAAAVQIVTVHAARAWSSRSSTCRSAGTATSRATGRAALHDDDGARVLDVGGPGGPRLARALRAPRGRGGRRGPAAALRRRSPGRSARW